MRRSRRQRIRRRRIIFATVVLLIAAGASGWWYLRTDNAAPSEAIASPNAGDNVRLIIGAPKEPAHREEEAEPQREKTAAAGRDEVLEPEGGPAAPPAAEPVELASKPRSADATDKPNKEEAADHNPAIVTARERYAAGKVLEARQALNALLTKPLSPADQAEVRELLAEIARDTLFSRRQIPGDPLAEVYTVEPGDVPERIAHNYKLPAEILLEINGIKDPRKMPAGAKLKVLRGPFHAKIYLSQFRMDVYLQDLYVRSFRVGLGADRGTPQGVWKVKERLVNPTYFPPPSAETRRIIPADDPDNPLGEYWIGLEGIEGNAAGRYGFGIHGTIEPESIGKAVSLGCVRMFNEDVALLYALMLPGQSTVTTLP